MSDHRMTWQNPRILCILLLVFLCGATAGAVAMRMGTSRRATATYWKEGGKEISLDRFKRELSLTPQQTKDMEVVLNDFVMYYQTVQEQMQEVRSSGKARIMQILDEGQRTRFLQMINDWQTKQAK